MSEAKIKDLRINKGLTKQQLIDSTVITENELSFVTDDTVVDVPAPTEVGKVLTSTENGVEWAEGGSGTSDYNQLSNKPQIENITLSGNNSLADLGIASVDALSNKLDKTTAARKLYGTNASGEQVRYDLSHFAAAADLDPLVIQWPVLPEPTASLEGVIYEYVGETNSTYTNGYFYKCVNSSSVEAIDAYSWTQLNVQPSSGGSPLPDQTGNAGKVLGTDGTNASWVNKTTVIMKKWEE